MQIGEVWFVRFPFEEDKTKHTVRPVIVLNSNDLKVLSVKVTKQGSRDEYDTPIIYWKHAKLRFESIARVSKTINLDKSDFVFRLGKLHDDDLKLIQTKFIEYVLNESR